LCIACLLLFATTVQAQDYLLFNRGVISAQNGYFSLGSNYHSAIHCSAFCSDADISFSQINTAQGSYIKRKVLLEHFGYAQAENYTLIADPLFHFELGKEIETAESLFVNTRGIKVFADLYNRIQVSTVFYENQAVFPKHINDYYSVFRIIPGEARVKPFGTGGYDWGSAYALISFKATDWLYVEAGNEKNFIGEGYRSLILSDYSPQYLHFKTIARFRNFFYMNMIGRTLNPNYNNITGNHPDWSENALYQHKMMNINYVGYNFNQYLQLSLFEASMFGVHVDFDKKATAIVPGFNELLHSTNDSLHFLWGANMLLYPIEDIGIYAQLVFDSNASLSYQLGVKLYSAGIYGNIFARLEWNHVPVGMYRPLDDDNFWGHYNQPLAHPAGSGFSELLLQAGYSYGRIQLSAKAGFIQYKHGLSSQNVFAPSNLQNNSETVWHSDMNLAYLLNPSYNWFVYAGASSWQLKGSGSVNVMPVLGMKTSLRNRYHDF